MVSTMLQLGIVSEAACRPASTHGTSLNKVPCGCRELDLGFGVQKVKVS